MSKKKSKTAKLSTDVRRKPSPLKLVKTSSVELDATEGIAEGIARRTVVDQVRMELPKAKLDAFLGLQGKLKVLTEEAFVDFRDRLLKKGFRVPLFVWADRRDKRIVRWRLLDGHQRVSTLRRMRDEGFTVPENLPYVQLEAADEIEAKDLLLSIVSQWGKIDDEGLRDFLEEAQLEPAQLEHDYALPDLNAPKFIEKFWPEKVAVSSHEKKRAKKGEGPKEFMLIVTVDSAEERDRMAADLVGRGLKVKIVE